MKVNYGLNRLVKGKRGARKCEHTQGAVTVTSDSHEEIMNAIKAVKPAGWNITGYAIIR